MEFFLDTADVDEIREIASWGILDGVTTNPSLIKKSGRDFKEVVEKLRRYVMDLFLLKSQQWTQMEWLNKHSS